MKPNQLRVFIAIVEAGSLASAAAALHRTQPAVSKTLREFEESLGLQLFNRVATGMTLTQAGSALLPRARAVLEELRRCDQDMALLRGENGGKIRIGASPACSLLVARALVSFRRRMPAVEVEVHDHSTSTLHELITSDRLDIAFGAQPSFSTLPSGVDSELLLSLSMALVTRRAGIYSPARSLADLRDATWVYVDPTGAQRDYVADQFRALNLEPPISSILCTSAQTSLILANEFDLVLLVTRDLQQIYDSRFVELPFLAEPPCLELFSLLRPGSVPTRATLLFLEYIRAALTEDLPLYEQTRFLLRQ